MTITIEGTQYTIPSSLMAITLGDRIEFDKQYGKDLQELLKKISDMKEGPARDLEFTDYHCQLACKTLSFFGKIPLDIIENTAIDEVLTIYHHTMKLMSEDVDFKGPEFILKQEFLWQDEYWQIAPPELKHDSAMTFGEFLDAKQWVKNLWELGQEKWEAILMLCCVYFRKKGERYDKQWAMDGSDRYQLMKSLPLEYALHVGFFLSGTMHGYLKTFPSFSPEGEEPAVLN